MLALASTTLAALWACFGFPPWKFEGVDNPDETGVLVWQWIDAIMEISFALDIIIHFFV